MPARKTPNKKATYCKLCGIPYNESFVGKKCHPCQLQYLKDYHASKKEELNEKAREKRRMNKLLEPPKEPKSRKRFSEEELKERNKVRTNIYNKRKGIRNYMSKHPEIYIRKPRKRKDFEQYLDDDTWAIENNYYLNIDALRDCPYEHLDAQFWSTLNDKLSAELNEYIAERMYEKYVDDNQRAKCDYTKKDIPYGLHEGKIRFWPT